MQTVEDYLFEKCLVESRDFFGLEDAIKTRKIAQDWLDDEKFFKASFETIKKMSPSANTILDMACGCGTAVFYGLLNGYDMYGIDPEAWKHNVIKMKIDQKSYPAQWAQRFYSGVGESLPFADNSFDGIMSWYTLEHVQDTEKCLTEMVRVIKNEGWIYITCPDYKKSSFEEHYFLPWFPFLSRRFAKAYLSMLGRPAKGVDTLNFVSQDIISNTFKELVKKKVIKQVEITDVHYLNFLRSKQFEDNHISRFLHFCRKYKRNLKCIFRAGVSINLYIKVVK